MGERGDQSHGETGRGEPTGAEDGPATHFPRAVGGPLPAPHVCAGWEPEPLGAVVRLVSESICEVSGEDETRGEVQHITASHRGRLRT